MRVPLLRPACFAPVAPIQILEELNEKNILGGYHLFLAHHTVEHPERFRALVKAYCVRERTYRPMRIIMDNSIVELGGAVDDQMIYESVKACITADSKVVPCLPDVMGSAQDTIDLSRQAYKRWEEMGMDKLSHCGYMLVTQGDFYGFRELVDHFFIHHKDEYKNISWVGIPRYMLKQGWDSRKWAIRYIQMVAPHVRIHLLGFSEDIIADILDAREPGVQGIDSAVPVRYKHLLTPSTTENEIGKRDPDWMEKGTLMSHTHKNLQRVRDWINPQLGLQNSI